MYIILILYIYIYEHFKPSNMLSSHQEVNICFHRRPQMNWATSSKDCKLCRVSVYPMAT